MHLFGIVIKPKADLLTIYSFKEQGGPHLQKEMLCLTFLDEHFHLVVICMKVTCGAERLSRIRV